MAILQSEAELQEIVKLVGQDALSAADRLTLETAKMLREDFLQQNAFLDVDTYSSYDRQEKLLALILKYDRLCRDAVSHGAETGKLFSIETRERIGRAKFVPDDTYESAYAAISDDMEKQIADAVRGAEHD